MHLSNVYLINQILALVYLFIFLCAATTICRIEIVRRMSVACFHYVLSLRLVWVVAMARPIKLFHFTQKLYHSFGLYPPESNDQSQTFNVKNGFIIFALVQIIPLSMAFFLFRANRLDEFGVSFHVSLKTLLALLNFITTICKMGNILKFIDKFEEFIEKSKKYQKYIKLNTKRCKIWW